MEILIVIGGILAIVVLLFASAFFSSSEMAIFSLPANWADDIATDGDRRAAILQGLYTDPHRLLVTILVGNNIVNIAITSIITILIATVLSPGIAVIVATVLTSVLILVFGEIIPKAFGLGNAKQWSLVAAVPLRAVAWVLSPLITIFDVVTSGLNALVSIDGDIETPYLEHPESKRMD